MFPIVIKLSSSVLSEHLSSTGLEIDAIHNSVIKTKESEYRVIYNNIYTIRSAKTGEFCVYKRA